MKIVIDIQDDVYRVLKEDIYPIPDTERLALVFKTLVKKGTALPKEHGGMSKDAEHIIKLIAKYFEPPCMYEYGDVDAFDFINKIDETEGINWCEEHCGSVSPCECWKRFFELMAKAEKEQMEEQNVN